MRRAVLSFLGILIIGALGFAGWAWLTLHYTYSRGERAGYVQKISQKGWVCKTWEGELAMANLPGAMPQIFFFTVPDTGVAHQIEQNAGQRVSLTYEQHRGVPTSCFGETEYFIVKMVPIKDGYSSQMPVSTNPAAAPAAPPVKK